MSSGDSHDRENGDERSREGMGEDVPPEHVTESTRTAPPRRRTRHVLTAAQRMARREALNMPPIRRQSVENGSTAAEEHIDERGDYVASPTTTTIRYLFIVSQQTPPAKLQDTSGHNP